MIVILVVEDEAAVRDAVVRDLEPFEGAFGIEVADDAEDARTVLDEIGGTSDTIGLVLCDHLLPGQRGTDFLIELHADEATRSIRKVLITGQAGHEDTIRAINQADLNHYIAKPWEPEQLIGVVRDELTTYVIDQGLDPLPYLAVLDGQRLLEVVGRRGDR